MAEKISPLAGKMPPLTMLVDIPDLITRYYNEIPDPAIAAQRVIFGTSGHRGTSLQTTFNEWHILAITEAICLYRKQHDIDGPLYLGIDTHALSVPAFSSALEVLAAHGIEVMLAKKGEYTPTPVISYSILTYNQDRTTGLADGIVITPSHNPPHDGGFKYNPPTGGPANIHITSWIENKANDLLKHKLQGIKRIPFEKALQATTTHYYDYLNSYVNDLESIIDMNVIKNSNVHIGVDPLGGAGIHYWEPIAERYQLNLSVTNKEIDPTFRFVPVDWDGQIRMNPASVYAMQKLIALKDDFDIAFACDTDHDRHGIVTPKGSLLPPNHYLCIAMSYLFQHRLQWPGHGGIGKTVVTTQMLDHISHQIGRSLYEVPVGFKWFVDGLLDRSILFCGEQSAGAAFSRINGSVWTTDKDGIIAALLSAEITAKLQCDITDIYQSLEKRFGKMFYKQQNTQATPAQKETLLKLSAKQIKTKSLAGDPIEHIITKAPGNKAAIGGVKVMSKNGWFVARPSGTEQIYEICAESFRDESHLNHIVEEAQTIVEAALNGSQSDNAR